MTARQPRRTRRRQAPAATLPRPIAGAPLEPGASPRPIRGGTVRHRQHHVTTDYGYVHRDLLAVAGIGSAVIAFIVAMSFLL
ncbi:MAG: hypothetical protein ACR2HN_08685 [Tepidiformaceae bacterium]